MRIPSSRHESQPWRIHELVPDFTLEDVWELPVHGRLEDFPRLLEIGTSLDPTDADSLAARALWRIRDLLGVWFNLGRIAAPEGGEPALPIPGTAETSLSERLPEDLRQAAWDAHFGDVPFRPLYRTATEAAAEVSNKTVHGVMHLGWVPSAGEDDRYSGQMAVYVKPRGRFGTAYMAFIKPFRYWVVYPALMRQIERRVVSGQS